MQRPNEDVTPAWLTHFGVDDIETAAREVDRLGGQVLLGPDPQLRHGLLAIVVDPNGALLALHQWTD